METEEERRIRRRRRMEQMRREKRRAEIVNRVVPAAGLAVIAACVVCVALLGKDHAKIQGDVQAGVQGAQISGESTPAPAQSPGKGRKETVIPEDEEKEEPRAVYTVRRTPDTQGFEENIVSKYGIVIDVEEGVILAQREPHTRMNPASMTKILTVLVAAERISEEQLSDTQEITIDITDYCFINECSVVGFSRDEKVSVKDLFYGTVLSSGADAALGLAKYVAGSHEAFVELMNEKLEELDLADSTHFTNCVGLYDEDHYSTAYDMALILKAAADNELCRKLLSTHIYSTGQTAEHPEGMTISNWFLRRIEDRDTHGEVLCGKTGYVKESGNCAASLAVDRDGREYICVTAASKGNDQCIEDQAILYRGLLPEG